MRPLNWMPYANGRSTIQFATTRLFSSFVGCLTMNCGWGNASSSSALSFPWTERCPLVNVSPPPQPQFPTLLLGRTIWTWRASYHVFTAFDETMMLEKPCWLPRNVQHWLVGVPKFFQVMLAQ